MFGKEDLGRAIKKLRGSRTQKECAEVASVSPSAWSIYEGGDRMPRATMFAKLARGLGVDPKVLEEAAWAERNQRVAHGSAEAQPAAVPAPAKEPLRRAVSEHTQAIAHHLHELFLLILPQDSR
jgi:transcriptional regulator with XRE-family HTH domain